MTAGAGSPPRLALSAFVALAIAMGVGRFAFTPILPLMQADSGLSLTGGSWLAFANYLGYLAGALAAVWLRAPAHIMVRAGLAGTGQLTLAMGLVRGFAPWWLLRFAGGVATRLGAGLRLGLHLRAPGARARRAPPPRAGARCGAAPRSPPRGTR